VHESDLAHAFRLTFDLSDAPPFPLVRVAVATAVVTVASPYLARPTRRIGQVLVVLLALVAMYLGRAFPLDVVAAFVLGWGAAAAVHYAFGTPARRPTPEQVASALRRLGLAATSVVPAAQQPVGRAIFLADTDVGRARVIALGRDEADAQFLARAWRFLAYRDAPPSLFPTRRRQVDAEAQIMRAAAEAGVRVPKVLGAGAHGAVAVLVVEQIDGASFSDLAPDHADAVLGDAWRQAATVHAAGLAHGRLDGDHLAVVGEEVSVIGWERASTDATSRQRDVDVAQLLAASAAAAGDERAVRAALDGVGRDAVVDAIPVLQPNALAWVTRDVLDEREGDALEALRDRAAEAAGVEPPMLRERFRVNPRQLLMAVGALVAVAFLLSRVGDPVEFWDSIKGADWWYLLLAFVLGIATDVAFAVAFLGTVPVRIPLWPSIELQSSMSFSNLAVPIAADDRDPDPVPATQRPRPGLRGGDRRHPQLDHGDRRAGRPVRRRALVEPRLDRLRSDRQPARWSWSCLPWCSSSASQQRSCSASNGCATPWCRGSCAPPGRCGRPSPALRVSRCCSSATSARSACTRRRCSPASRPSGPR